MVGVSLSLDKGSEGGDAVTNEVLGLPQDDQVHLGRGWVGVEALYRGGRVEDGGGRGREGGREAGREGGREGRHKYIYIHVYQSSILCKRHATPTLYFG